MSTLLHGSSGDSSLDRMERRNQLAKQMQDNVNAFNNWRQQNPGPIDLAGANLKNAKLRGVDLSDADLTHAYLGEADLSGANLSNAILDRAALHNTTFYGANLEGASMIDVTDLDKAKLRGANMHGVRFSDETQWQIVSTKGALTDDVFDPEPSRICTTQTGAPNPFKRSDAGYWVSTSISPGTVTLAGRSAGRK